MNQRKCISIVVPACNEEGNIQRVYDEVTAALEPLNQYTYEVIVIDNGSTDRTPEMMVSICESDERWRFIRFSRNFGAESSISTGLRIASGDAVVTLFSDLQDPPDRIPDLIKEWEAGYDVVCGRIEDRQDSYALRSIAAKLAYRMIRFFSDIDLPVDSGDFRLLDRKAVDAFNALPERERYVRGLMHWVGFRKTYIPYCRRPRKWGRSKASFLWCFEFTLNAIASFSIKPLRLFLLFGLLVLFVSVVASGFYVVGKFMTNPPPGVTTTLVLLLWNLAVMSIGIGVLGEYIGHIYMESKRRPLAVIERVENLSEKQQADLQQSLSG